MTMPRVTIDTTDLASTLLASPDSTLEELLAGLFEQRFDTVLSESIFAQLERALAKPYFRRRATAARLATYQEELRAAVTITPLTVTVTGVASHPSDDLILATALSGGAQFLITGDHRLLDLRVYQGVVIVTAREFLALLPGLLDQPPAD